MPEYTVTMPEHSITTNVIMAPSSEDAATESVKKMEDYYGNYPVAEGMETVIVIVSFKSAFGDEITKRFSVRGRYAPVYEAMSLPDDDKEYGKI